VCLDWRVDVGRFERVDVRRKYEESEVVWMGYVRVYM